MINHEDVSLELRAAIEYALSPMPWPNGLEWLRAWTEGDLDAVFALLDYRAMQARLEKRHMTTQDGTRKELGTGRTLPRSSYVDQDGRPVRYDGRARGQSADFNAARYVYEVDAERRVLRVVKSPDDAPRTSTPWRIPEARS